MTAATLEMVFTVIQRQLILPRHLHAADSVIRMTPARPLPCYHGFEQQDFLHTNGRSYRRHLLGKSLGCGSKGRMEGLLDALAELDVSSQVRLNQHACSLAHALSLRRTNTKAV
jgi:hypothetical protein